MRFSDQSLNLISRHPHITLPSNNICYFDLIARSTLDVTQAIQISVVGDGETHPVHHLTVNSPQSTTGVYLTLNNNSEYDKLSLISERSASGERSVVCSPDVEHKPLVIERQVSQVSQQSEGEVNVAASLTECDLKNRTESEA